MLPRQSTYALIAVLTLLLFGTFQASATHVAGGTFNAYCLGDDPDSVGMKLYEVVIKMYRDCEGVPMDRTFNNDQLRGRNHDRPIPLLVHSSCGATAEYVDIDQYEVVELTQICESHIPQSSCNGGYLPGIQEATVKFYMSLDPNCDYEFEWWAADRNGNIRNLVSPRDHTMYWNAELYLTKDECMDLPEVKDKPVPFVCEGSEVRYNVMSEIPGEEGDSLRFSFTNAKAAEKIGGAPDNYTGDIYNLLYTGGTSASQPIPGISIDPLTGFIEFQAPNEGWWDVTVLIDIYDRDTGEKKGSKTFDFPFIVLGNCGNDVPDVPDNVSNLDGPATTTANNIVAACDQGFFCFDIEFEDVNAGDNLTIVEHTLNQLPGATMTTSGSNPLTATICWTADSAYDGTVVSFTVRDDACPLYAENVYNFEFSILCDIWWEVDFTEEDVCLGETSDFEASTGGTIQPDSWLWNFGDGNFSTDQNPSHTYADVGTYQVQVSASSSAANETIDTAFSVRVYEQPVAVASSEPDAVTCQERVLGSVTVTANPLTDGQTLLYDIGDGPQTSNVFPELGGGDYSIDVISDPGGCVTTVEINVPELSNTQVDTAYISPGDSVICVDGDAYQLSATMPDGIWRGTGITDSEFGIFNPTVAGEGLHVITYDMGDPCVESEPITIEVKDFVDINIYDAGPFCISEGHTFLDAEANGVTWSGPGIIDPVLGQFDPATAGLGYHEIIATKAGVCTSHDTLFIAVYPLANTLIDPVDTVCVQSSDFNLTADVVGGKWTGSGIVDRNEGLFSPQDAGVGTHTVYYMMDSACAEQALTVVDVTGPNPLSVTSVPSMCSDADPVQVVANPDTVTWTGNGINATTGIFNPVVAGAGNHVVTARMEGICVVYRSTVIQVQQKIIGAIDTILPLCESLTAVPLTANGVFGTWGGTGVSTNGVFNPSSVGPGVHEIFFTPSAVCNEMDSIDVEVLEIPEFSISGPDIICTANVAEELVTTLAPGIWNGQGITDTILGNFNPASAGPGSHIITYLPDSACAEQKTLTIEVEAPEDVTISPLGPFCESANPFNFVSDVQGVVWHGTGIVDSVTGEFDPSVADVGFHDITAIKTAVCTSIGNAQVEVLPDIGPLIDDLDPVCSSSGAFPLSASIDGGIWGGEGVTDSITGIFDPQVVGVGSHQITYIVDTVCAVAAGDVVTVEDPVDLEIDPIGPQCEAGDAVQLAADPTDVTWIGNGVDSVTGVFDPVASGVGIHEIFARLDYVCVVYDSINIMVQQNIIGDIDPLSDLCEDETPLQMTANGQVGTWSGPGITNSGVLTAAIAGDGIHTIYFTPSGLCSIQDSTEVTIVEVPTAIVGGPAALCSTDLPVILTTTGSDGIWRGAGITDSIFGTFNPTVAGGGIHEVTYQLDQQCANEQPIQIMVDEPETVLIQQVGPFCTSGSPVLMSSNVSGASWSGNGILNESVGIFSPQSAGPGLHIVNLVKTDICVSEGQTTVLVLPEIKGSIEPTDPLCVHSDPYTLETNMPGGTWSGHGIIDPFNGVFDPGIAGIGSHNVFYTADTACAVEAVDVITVEDRDTLTIATASPVCESTNPFALTSSPSGAYWFGTGIRDSINGIFDPRIAGPGFHDITARLEGVCVTIGSAQIQIIETAYAEVDSVPDLCEYDGEYALGAGDQLGVWVGEDITSAGVINTASVGPGEHQFVFRPSGVCVVEDTAEVFIIDAPDVQIETPDVICQGGEEISLSATDTGGMWSGTGVTDESRGTFSPNEAGVGSHILTYHLDGQCPVTVEKTIMVEAVPEIIIDMPAQSGCEPYEVQFQLDEAQLNPTVVDFYEWNFDDGLVGYSRDSTAHTYDVPGTYYVTFNFTTHQGCSATAGDTVQIDVHPNPTADFEVLNPDALNVDDITYATNLSEGNDYNTWRVDGADVSQDVDFEHLFGIGGQHTISLETATEFGCTANHQDTVEVYMAPVVHTPTAFSPNGDGVNDRFTPFVYGIQHDKSKLLIFNRWGDLIHVGAPGQEPEANEVDYYSDELSWDGFYKGVVAKSDVYTYKLLYKTSEDEARELEQIGRVTLIR